MFNCVNALPGFVLGKVRYGLLMCVKENLMCFINWSHAHVLL